MSDNLHEENIQNEQDNPQQDRTVASYYISNVYRSHFKNETTNYLKFLQALAKGEEAQTHTLSTPNGKRESVGVIFKYNSHVVKSDLELTTLYDAKNNQDQRNIQTLPESNHFYYTSHFFYNIKSSPEYNHKLSNDNSILPLFTAKTSDLKKLFDYDKLAVSNITFSPVVLSGLYAKPDNEAFWNWQEGTDEGFKSYLQESLYRAVMNLTTTQMEPRTLIDWWGNKIGHKTDLEAIFYTNNTVFAQDTLFENYYNKLLTLFQLASNKNSDDAYTHETNNNTEADTNPQNAENQISNGHYDRRVRGDRGLLDDYVRSLSQGKVFVNGNYSVPVVDNSVELPTSLYDLASQMNHVDTNRELEHTNVETFFTNYIENAQITITPEMLTQTIPFELNTADYESWVRDLTDNVNRGNPLVDSNYHNLFLVHGELNGHYLSTPAFILRTEKNNPKTYFEVNSYLLLALYRWTNIPLTTLNELMTIQIPNIDHYNYLMYDLPNPEAAKTAMNQHLQTAYEKLCSLLNQSINLQQTPTNPFACYLANRIGLNMLDSALHTPLKSLSASVLVTIRDSFLNFLMQLLPNGQFSFFAHDALMTDICTVRTDDFEPIESAPEKITIRIKNLVNYLVSLIDDYGNINPLTLSEGFSLDKSFYENLLSNNIFANSGLKINALVHDLEAFVPHNSLMVEPVAVSGTIVTEDKLNAAKIVIKKMNQVLANYNDATQLPIPVDGPNTKEMFDWIDDHSLDKSQYNAVMLMLSHALVAMKAPAGNGKTRTLALLVLNLLAHGKKVAFVSAKAAAVEAFRSQLSLINTNTRAYVLKGKVRETQITEKQRQEWGYSTKDVHYTTIANSAEGAVQVPVVSTLTKLDVTFDTALSWAKHYDTMLNNQAKNDSFLDINPLDKSVLLEETVDFSDVRMSNLVTLNLENNPQNLATLLTGQYDYIIIDEASQMKAQELQFILGATKNFSHLILSGDNKQIQPTATGNDRRFGKKRFESALGWVESLNVPTALLSVHYRAKDAKIIDYSNKYIYQNKLAVINEMPRKNRLFLHRVNSMKEPYDQHFQPLANINIAAEDTNDVKYVNPTVNDLVLANLLAYDPKDVVVISFSQTTIDYLTYSLRRLAKDPAYRNIIKQKITELGLRIANSVTMIADDLAGDLYKDGMYFSKKYSKCLKTTIETQGITRKHVILDLDYAPTSNYNKLFINFGVYRDEKNDPAHNITANAMNVANTRATDSFTAYYAIDADILAHYKHDIDKRNDLTALSQWYTWAEEERQSNATNLASVIKIADQEVQTPQWYTEWIESMKPFFKDYKHIQNLVVGNELIEDSWFDKNYNMVAGFAVNNETDLAWMQQLIKKNYPVVYVDETNKDFIHRVYNNQWTYNESKRVETIDKDAIYEQYGINVVFGKKTAELLDDVNQKAKFLATVEQAKAAGADRVVVQNINNELSFKIIQPKDNLQKVVNKKQSTTVPENNRSELPTTAIQRVQLNKVHYGKYEKVRQIVDNTKVTDTDILSSVQQQIQAKVDADEKIFKQLRETNDNHVESVKDDVHTESANVNSQINQDIDLDELDEMYFAINMPNVSVRANQVAETKPQTNVENIKPQQVDDIDDMYFAIDMPDISVRANQATEPQTTTKTIESKNAINNTNKNNVDTANLEQQIKELKQEQNNHTNAQQQIFWTKESRAKLRRLHRQEAEEAQQRFHFDTDVETRQLVPDNDANSNTIQMNRRHRHNQQR